MKNQKQKRTNQDYVIMAEFRLLKYLTSNPHNIADSRIHEGIFYYSQSKTIYQAILNLIKRNEPINFSSVFQEANKLDFTITQDSIKYLFELDNENLDLQSLLNLLENASKRKEITKQLSTLLSKVSSYDDLDYNDILKRIYDIGQIVSSNLFKQSPLKSLDQWIDEYIDELEHRKQGKQYIFGDVHLDKYLTRKAAPGQFILLAGATGTGKSAYALNLVNGFINLGIPSIYISLEMDGISTMDRLIALRLEIPIDELYQTGNGLNPIIEKVRKEKEELENNKLFYFVENPTLSLAQIQSIIREFKQRANSDYCIVVCDLVTMIKDFQEIKHNKTLANTIEIAVNNLNAMCKEENICFLGIAQFNRLADSTRISSIEELDLLRPQLNHIKNSHALAERARVLLSIFRPYYYAKRYLSEEETQNIEDTIEVQILKQSQGIVGKTMKYLFDPAVMRLDPVDSDNNGQEE